MIHSELPKAGSATNKTYKKKYTSIITPDKILLNEKLMLSLMFSGMGLVLIAWAIRKGK